MPECLLGCAQLNRPDKVAAPHWVDLQLQKQEIADAHEHEKTRVVPQICPVPAVEPLGVIEKFDDNRSKSDKKDTKGISLLSQLNVDLWDILNNSSSEEEA